MACARYDISSSILFRFPKFPSEYRGNLNCRPANNHNSIYSSVTVTVNRKPFSDRPMVRVQYCSQGLAVAEAVGIELCSQMCAMTQAVSVL